MNFRAFYGNRDNELALVSLGYILLVVVNVYQSLGAATYMVLVALIRPRYIPYLLILLATIQDGPGIYKMPRYAAIAMLAAVMFIYTFTQLSDFQRIRRQNISTHFPRLVFLGLITVLYGLIVSFVIDVHNQSKLLDPTRPYHLVAATNIVMIMAAYLATLVLSQDRSLYKNLFTVSAISLGYLLLAALVQMLVNPSMLHSQFLLESHAFQFGSQMSATNTLGIARIASGMETPNAFCLSVAFLFMLLYISAQQHGHSLALPTTLAGIGLFVGFVTLSKAQLGYFIVTAVLSFVVVKHIKFRAIGFLSLAVSLFAVLYFGNSLIDYVTEIFRIREFSGSTRGLMWEVVMENMKLSDWLFGRGYGHWEELFSDVYLYKSITSPHNYLMYVLGTFGFMGMAMYAFILSVLLTCYKRLRSHNIRVALVALMLILFLFVKDLFTTSYVFNTSPLTYLLWLCFGLLCIHLRKQPALR